MPVARPTAARRTAPAVAAPPAQRVAFGELANYGGGDFLVPEGDYAIFHDVRVHSYTKQDGTKGQPMLGVMLTCVPLAGGEVHEQFMGLGRKALAAFAPDPDNPADNGLGSKSLVPIPGVNGTLAGLTNWKLYLDSAYDCGLPEGVFVDEVSALDGIWVHLKHVLEPESRKSLGSATGEVQQQNANRGPQKIAIIDEIKEDGHPWEGTGGMPESAEATPVKSAAPVKATAAAKPVAAKPVALKKVAAPAPEPEVEEAGELDMEEVKAAADGAIATVLGANPNGIKRLMMKTKVFTEVKNTLGDDMAQAVTTNIVNVDAVLAQVLGEYGWTLKGQDVVPPKA